MGNDGSSWKLLIYPVAFFLVVGVILNLVITPFLNSGNAPILNPSFSLSIVKSTIGVLGSVMPIGVRTFINTEITVFGILPSDIQNILFILSAVALGYIVVVIIQGFIP